MKVLVLGANGMVGSMMSRYLSEHHEVTSMYRKDLDAESADLPDFYHYDCVVNCIGVIKQKSSDDKLLYSINASFPHRLSLVCKKLVHISSDCVFSGRLPEHLAYKTLDVRDAQDNYGQSKAMGEPRVAIVLRTSVIGPSRDSAGLFELFRATKDNPVKGFSNHWWSGVTTLELAKMVNNLLEADLKNQTYQIASEKISKLHLLHLINSTFNLGKNIVPTKAAESINRVLEPDLLALPLADQLYQLKHYME